MQQQLAGEHRDEAAVARRGVEITDQNKNKILPVLSRLGVASCLPAVLLAVADLKHTDEDGFTVLMLECKENKEEAAALLMEETENASALDVQSGDSYPNYKLSAMHYASSSWLESIVAKLLSLGADDALKDEWCKTALDVATNDEVKAALRQHGARHSLLYAAEKGMIELVEDLIKEDADVYERNKAGNTAVDRAQNVQTIEVLKGAGTTMPEFPEEKRNDLLIEYAQEGSSGGVLMSIQAGGDVNHKDVDWDEWTQIQ
jgi:hypothetical protein